MAFIRAVLPPYRHVFDIPVASKTRRKYSARPDWQTLSEHERLMECEFSEMGRNPLFVPGWYILPGLVLGVVTLAILL